MRIAISLATLMTVLAVHGCSGARSHAGQGEQLQLLVASAAQTGTGGDSCVRVHHLWKTQARVALEMEKEPAWARKGAIVEQVYEPHRAFWDGYVGDRPSFVRLVADRWSALGSDPRATIPADTDIEAILLDASTRAALLAERPTPCADWHFVYGPGVAAAGRVSSGQLFVDIFGLRPDGGRDEVRVAAVREVARLVIARAPDPDAETLLRHVIDEGLATYFAVHYWNGAVSPATALGYSGDEWRWALANEERLWLRAEQELSSSNRKLISEYNAERMAFAADPGKIGHFLGYRIVEAYARRNGDDSWRDIFRLPLRRVLPASGYSPGR
jgi:hypothetical protein